MVRCDSGNDGRLSLAGASTGVELPAEVSPLTGGPVSSCGGTVLAMFEVNYAKYET
jgi:hypothetical protein